MLGFSYQFGDVEAHGAAIRARAQSLLSEQGAILKTVQDASDFWHGAGSAQHTTFVAELNKNFMTIIESANDHGNRVQAAGNNMADTDHSGGATWS